MTPEEAAAAYDEYTQGGSQQLSAEEAAAAYDAYTRPEASWGEAIGSRVLGIIPEIAKTAADAQIMAAENIPGISYLGVTPDKGRYVKERAEQTLSDIYERNYVPENSLKSNVASGISAAAKFLPAMAFAPEAILPQILLESTPTHYGDLRSVLDEDGQPVVSPGKAAAASVGLGAVDTAAAALPVGRALGSRSVLNKLITTPLAFELMGGISGGAQMAADKALLGQTRIPEGQFQDTVINAAKRNAIHGLLFGGLGALEGKASEGKPIDEATLPNVGEAQPFTDQPGHEIDVNGPTEPPPAPPGAGGMELKVDPLPENAVTDLPPEPVVEIETPKAPAIVESNDHAGDLPEPLSELAAKSEVPQESKPLPVTEEKPYQPVSKYLTDPDHIAAEKAFYEKINADPRGIVDKYINENTKGKTVTIDTDRAREFSDHYKEDRTKFASAVHEPASDLGKMAYEEALNRAPANSLVVALGGGGGSGKSSNFEDSAFAKDADIVLDGTMSNAKSTEAKIHQALDKQHKVLIHFTWSGVNEGAQRAVIRAIRSGRPVPYKALGEAHHDAPATAIRLYEKFKDNPNVEFVASDNSGKTSKPMSIEELAQKVYTEVEGGKQGYVNRAHDVYENAIRQAKQAGNHDPEKLAKVEADFERTRTQTPKGDNGSIGQIGRESSQGVSGALQERERINLADSEQGSIVIPFKGFNLGQKLKDLTQGKDATEGIEEILNDKGPFKPGTNTKVEPEESSKFFQGEVFGRKVKLVSDADASFRRYVSRPSAIAKRFPQAKKVFDAQKELWRDREQVTFNLYNEGKYYFDLIDKTNVNKALASAQYHTKQLAKDGKQLVVTPESLQKAGLSPEEIQGYQAARKMLDSGWDILEQRALEKASRIADPEKAAMAQEEVKRNFAERKLANYAPVHRFGEHFAYGTKEGEAPWYSLHDRAVDAKKTAENLQARGFNVRHGELRKNSQEAYEHLPKDVSLDILKLFPDKEAHDDASLPLNGFKGHLVERKLASGFEKQMERNIAEYVQGIGSMAAKLRHEQTIKDSVVAIDKAKRPELFDYWARWEKYVNSNAAEGQALRSFFAHYYLGFLNPKSALVNASQPLTTTYPELGKITKNPLAALGRAYKLAHTSPEKLSKSDSELFNAINIAKERGVVSNEAARELAGARKGLPGQKRTWSDTSMMLFSAVEKENRLVSFIAGFKAAPKEMPFADRVKFAEDFTDKTQYIYSKRNRPEMGRGKLAPFFTFRNFQFNYLGQLRENIGEGEWKAVARMLAPMIAFGGLVAAPGVKEVVGALTAAGYDPKRKVREVLPRDYMSDLLLYGWPFMAGVNISGAIGPGELAPDFEKGVGPAALRLMGGVPMGTLQRLGKAKYNYDMAGFSTPEGVERTIEPLLPEGLRGPAVAARAYAEGGFRDPRGLAVMKDPKVGELLAKSLGFTPSRLSKAYEQQQSIETRIDQLKDDSSGYNAKIARAVAFGDNERAQTLVKEMMEKGIAPDPSAIKKRLLEIQSLDYSNIKKTPKRGLADILDIMRTYRKH